MSAPHLYGLDAKQIENALYSAYGPELASNIYTSVNQYQVLEEMKPKYQEWTEYLSKIYFKAGNGQLVPLDSLAKVTPDVGPQSIAHSGELPSVTLSFNLKTGVSLGAAVDGVTELAARAFCRRPYRWGSPATRRCSRLRMQNLTLLLIVAIGVVYIVLGVLYESYIHPITILSGLPSAGVGALLTLILFKDELNIYSFVGLVMLVGIVKKNAIMQIDFALEAERKHGKSPGRRDLRRLPDPLPPHHDDHHGGAAGRGSDGAGLRRGRRSSPSAGPGGGGRPAVLAVDDAVSDAGGVHLHGEHPGLVPRRATGGARIDPTMPTLAEFGD